MRQRELDPDLVTRSCPEHGRSISPCRLRSATLWEGPGENHDAVDHGEVNLIELGGSGQRHG
ncbi:MAG: hypothetical protein ACREFY_03480, partial [Acetobacteraceae bacterium]